MILSPDQLTLSWAFTVRSTSTSTSTSTRNTISIPTTTTRRRTFYPDTVTANRRLLPYKHVQRKRSQAAARDDDNDNDSNNDNDNDSSTGSTRSTTTSTTSTSAKVRFSGFELLDKGKQGQAGSGSTTGSTTSTTSTNPLDSILSLFTSDIGSIVLGSLGLLLLVMERLSLPDATTLGMNPVEYAEQLGEETRSNLIAVLATGSVLLNGLSKLDVTSAVAEAVVLEGVTLTEPMLCWGFNRDSDSDDKQTHTKPKTTMLKWAMESLIAATPAKSVVLLEKMDQQKQKWQVMAMMGTVPREAAPTNATPIVLPHSTPILDRSQQDNSNTQETQHLPTLQALPGKTEFLSYLPGNTQEVLILSIPTDRSSGANSKTTMALVLGSNRAKSFTPRNIAWSRTITARLGQVLINGT